MKASLLLALLLVGAAAVRAEERAWGCVVLATCDKGKPANPDLERYLPVLQRVFGYSHYHVIGSAWATDSMARECYVVPTQEFFLRLEPKGGAARGASRLEIELHQNERVLMKSTVKMPAGKPLFITGPEFGRGRLILIVEKRLP